MPGTASWPMLAPGPNGHLARTERERGAGMLDVVHTWWSRLHPADGVDGERGTTTLEYLMLVALVVATIVTVASLGASLTGTEVA
jgi:hypothetical protein